jgi:hypothetical protein
MHTPNIITIPVHVNILVPAAGLHLDIKPALNVLGATIVPDAGVISTPIPPLGHIFVADFTADANNYLIDAAGVGVVDSTGANVLVVMTDAGGVHLDGATYVLDAGGFVIETSSQVQLVDSAGVAIPGTVV